MLPYVSIRCLGKVSSFQMVDMLQMKIMQSLLSNREKELVGELLLFELTSPVITLGRREHYSALSTEQKDQYLVTKSKIESAGAQFIEVSRGGRMTFHGPGQLVVYPIFDLTRMGCHSLHMYVGMLHQVICNVCHSFGIASIHPFDLESSSGVGVWVNGNKKIASIGFSASRWVTSHGFALNVSNDLSWFNLFSPCGMSLSEKSIAWDVTSIYDQLKDSPVTCPGMKSVNDETIKKFRNVFPVHMVITEHPSFADSNW